MNIKLQGFHSDDYLLSTLRRRIATWRASNERVALCHGCFDLLHRGHIEHFQEARSFADRLVVTITRDRFVNKGPSRPVLPELDRAAIVAAIRYVDAVAVSDHPTAIEALDMLRPDIFVKGIDYAPGSNSLGFLQEKSAANSLGIKLMFTGAAKQSSTDLLRGIRGETQ